MPIWDPVKTRAKAELSLTDAERSAILAKLPQREDGTYCADAIFEGGGVKGTAFLGALRCFNDVGIQWKKVAGTSAGAITATLVVADLGIDTLEQIIGGLDYLAAFLPQKTSPFILNGDPKDDLDKPIGMILGLLTNQKLGQYSTDPFKRWLQDVLGDRLRTFKDIAWRDGRALKVVVSDISLGEMLVLPDDLNRRIQGYRVQDGLDRSLEFEVAEAVRLSMSIPFFFTPGKLGDSTIVDGGILSNFPLWLFDVTSPNQPPRWPTFGLRLSEDGQRQKIGNAIDIFSALLQTAMKASDRYHLQRNGQGRVIHINTEGVSATEFNLSNETKDYLYINGYRDTKKFLLEEWSWDRHLKLRGYDLASI
ncbi:MULTISPECIES: patatin-like phospholipase family protein [unclassified Leptolyngbya]|uniref:patatin-like phospholipase family protein n=1 Tax=unclassified Leptolyngbya TaxID=2650499 RepID=UPI001684F762|nr:MULTISPECIES: patatin-like phospholipase family protein [unclassified Leptolyngbya]MBD1913107.1 patatin-like phospholipase family protein [Leptolyngbya sp. FACHB-8]MBD2153243.1 patatin-like phospholipase family protein [Leptolyngbya sp. FACHB-16]